MTWGNPLSVSVADAERLGLRDGDLALLGAGGRTVRLPVLVQPGQAEGVLALALGYGRAAGEVAKGVGVNAFPLLASGPAPNLRRDATLARGAGREELAITQGHHRMEGRDLVRCYDPGQLAELEHKPISRPDLATLYPPPVTPAPSGAWPSIWPPASAAAPALGITFVIVRTSFCEFALPLMS